MSITSFFASADAYAHNLLLLGTLYPQGSERSLICAEAEGILEELIALKQGKQHPCILAAQWSQFEPSALLWFYI